MKKLNKTTRVCDKCSKEFIYLGWSGRRVCDNCIKAREKKYAEDNRERFKLKRAEREALNELEERSRC